MILTHAGARQMLTDLGASIKHDRLLLPPALVEDCLAKCPSLVSLSGRGARTSVLGDGALHFHNLGGARDIYDPYTNQKRFATLQDLRDATRLLDALGSLHQYYTLLHPHRCAGGADVAGYVPRSDP